MTTFLNSKKIQGVPLIVLPDAFEAGIFHVKDSGYFIVVKDGTDKRRRGRFIRDALKIIKTGKFRSQVEYNDGTQILNIHILAYEKRKKTNS